MSVKINELSKDRKQFEKIVRDFLFDEVKPIVKDSEKYLTEQLNRTLKLKGNKSGFKNARPRIKSSLKKDNKKGFVLKQNAFMAYQLTNNEHKVWHIVNAGRPGITVTKHTVFPVFKNPPRRTKPFSTAVAAKGQLKGFRAVAAGGRLEGFPGRHWYSLISSRFEGQKLSTKKYLIFSEVKITHKDSD